MLLRVRARSHRGPAEFRRDVKVVNRIVNGRTSVSAEMALKLGASFRRSSDFWLNAQKAIDLYEARTHVRRLPKPFPMAS